MSRFNRSGLVVVGVLLLFFAASRDVEAEAFFRQFGTLAPVLAPGQGVSFVLGGTQRPGQVIPELSFHLRLFINRGATLLGNETLAPELIFSPGDVLRFRLGDAVVIYQYDDPTNILDPPFMHFGFVAPTDIDDNFAPDSPIGRALAQNDTNGTTLSLEVLAGDGVRFSGLEIADPVAGTFQQCGASTLTRIYEFGPSETVTVDFESLTEATPVTDQFADLGITFFGDTVFDEQGVLEALGAGLDLLEGRMLRNQSPTPPLGRAGFVGMRYSRPVDEVRFDFAGPSSTLAFAFDGDFESDALGAWRFTGAAGGSGLSEGSAALSYPDGFDSLIIAETEGLLLDNVSVTFLRRVTVDFEGFHSGTILERQLEATGITFFGDGVTSEDMVSSGVGFDSLEGSVLVNSSTTPPLSAPGFIGIQFDHPVTSLRFDYAGPTLLVDAFLGGFTSADLIATRQFVPAIGSTGFSEGTVEILIPGGFDRIIVAEGREPVAIDNVSVNFLPE